MSGNIDLLTDIRTTKKKQEPNAVVADGGWHIEKLIILLVYYLR